MSSPVLFTLAKDRYDAVIFDLDGVITQTAEVHAAVWKQMFDEYLQRRGESYRPFDLDSDYRRYVDGKPRYEGVKSFLESRGIMLPLGDPEDTPDQETLCGLGNRKNQLFQQWLRHKGVAVYPSSIELIRQLRSQGFKTAIVSSSKNCRTILEAVGITELFDAQVDGVEAARLGLQGKPAADIFLEAAQRLQVPPSRAVVVEDAIAGVQAGRAGGFGRVIGVDRGGHGDALQANGADRVVDDLAKIGVQGSSISASDATGKALPSALERFAEIAERAREMRLAVFLDYDGTLTPIVDRPEQAILSEAMRNAIQRLSEQCPVAIVSGRDLGDVRALVGIDGIFYAGSHGFDIAAPKGRHRQYQQGTDFLPALDRAEQALRERLNPVQGALVERKRFAIAVHYRLVAEQDQQAVETAVDQVVKANPQLRKYGGKKIYELRPAMEWDKGRAVDWLLKALDLDAPDVLPLYLGDDVTDEDAFRALRGRGIGIRIAGDDDRQDSQAHYALQDPNEVRQFLQTLSSILERDVQ